MGSLKGTLSHPMEAIVSLCIEHNVIVVACILSNVSTEHWKIAKLRTGIMPNYS